MSQAAIEADRRKGPRFRRKRGLGALKRGYRGDRGEEDELPAHASAAAGSLGYCNIFHYFRHHSAENSLERGEGSVVDGCSRPSAGKLKPMIPRNVPCLCATLFVLLMVLASRATAQDPVTFVLSGVVEAVDPGPNGFPPPWDTVQPGDEWSVAYTFDPGAPDADPSANAGQYNTAVSILNVRAGGASVTQFVGGETSAGLTVLDGAPGEDQYSGSFEWHQEGTRFKQSFGVTDLEGQVFSSDALPATLDL